MTTIPLLIVIASIVLPIYLSGKTKARPAVRTLWVTIAVLALVWTVLCLKVYPLYVRPE